MITPRDLVVFFGPETFVQRLSSAVALAERWNAHLIGVFLLPPSPTDLAEGFAVGETAIDSVLAHQADLERRAESDVRPKFEATMARHGITGEWRLSRNEPHERALLHARHAALSIVGPSEADRVEFQALSLCEDVLLASGRPTLLVPTDWGADPIGLRIAVGWNGSREATRAISDAMPFMVEADSVSVVVIDEEKTRQRLDSDKPGLDLCHHLARYGVPVTLNHVPEAPAGEALLQQAVTFGADLLVMGAYSRPKLSERVFGGATRTILSQTPLPVLLSQ
jgi:nucleotide-binding universal stress UspA family protein